MKIENFDNIEIETNSEFIALKSEEPLTILSSGTLNGGYSAARTILNLHVEKDYDHPNSERYLKEKAKEMELPTPVVGLMTAAELEDYGKTWLKEKDVAVHATVTAGISQPIVSGVTDSYHSMLNTINAIVLVDGDMDSRAMVDAVRTITEAKSTALRETDIRADEGSRQASGTPTDAVAIACTGRGEKIDYAGPVTRAGSLIGKCVRKACKESLNSCGFNPGRSLAKRLEEREIFYDEILDTAEEAFVKNPSFEEGDVRKKLEEELEDAFKDANLSSLILSGLRLEEDGKYGLIPNLPNEDFESDPVHLLADEIIGMRIANYINGSKGIFEFERIDRNKPGILGKLGPFLDDVIGGLIGGICSRAYERRNQNENS